MKTDPFNALCILPGNSSDWGIDSRDHVMRDNNTVSVDGVVDSYSISGGLMDSTINSLIVDSDSRASCKEGQPLRYFR